VTQQAVARALGKLLTDENFRDRLFTNPRDRDLGGGVHPFIDRARGAQPTLPRPRSPGGGKGGAHMMTDQIVREPAHKNGTFRGQLS
jgi:hypothetical protein